MVPTINGWVYASSVLWKNPRHGEQCKCVVCRFLAGAEDADTLIAIIRELDETLAAMEDCPGIR